MTERRAGRPQRSMRQELEAFLVHGDFQGLPQWAEEVANELSKVRRHQVRRVFGEVQRIRMLAKRGDLEQAQRRLLMLRPRLAYQAARPGQDQLGRLQQVVDEAVPLVSENLGSRLERFYEVIEAIVAYHRGAE